jgi:hypothetical protein
VTDLVLETKSAFDKELKSEKTEKHEKDEVKESKESKDFKGERKEQKDAKPESAESSGLFPMELPLDRSALLQHAEALEETARRLRHFIEEAERPDLRRGALRDEPDQGEDPSGGG